MMATPTTSPHATRPRRLTLADLDAAEHRRKVQAWAGTDQGALNTAVGDTAHITADDAQLVDPHRYGAHHWGRTSYSPQQPATDTDLLGLMGTGANVPEHRIAAHRERLPTQQHALRRARQPQRMFADKRWANRAIKIALLAAVIGLLALPFLSRQS